jgi:hypothetical protein
VKMRSIAAGSAGTACRYTSSGSFEFGMAPSSAKVKVCGAVIACSFGRVDFSIKHRHETIGSNNPARHLLANGSELKQN